MMDRASGGLPLRVANECGPRLILNVANRARPKILALFVPCVYRARGYLFAAAAARSADGNWRALATGSRCHSPGWGFDWLEHSDIQRSPVTGPSALESIVDGL